MSAADLLPLLTCPVCREGDLLGLHPGLQDGEIRCSRCEASYQVRDGIPILLPPDLDQTHIHDELDHMHQPKRQQAQFFDREVAAEFEIERPHGAPRVYRWLMAEKFRRSVARLPSLRGATVLDACCGSGMDAEFLVGEGAAVIALDLSEGCAQRARLRARRRGLDYLVVVGDIEHLPLRDLSLDVTYVHDGLHHLEEPHHGIRELARVAGRAVSINEPARALGTNVAVALGFALSREESGNLVARLRPEAVCDDLASAGFRARADRYLMYYRHEPGRVMRSASRPLLYPIYRGAVGLADTILGRWGNKLQVTAIRNGLPSPGAPLAGRRLSRNRQPLRS